jgi:hypothetical protein
VKKTWSFYRLSDGTFTGRTLCVPDNAIAMNTPAGLAVKAGIFDHLSQRVDVDSGEVVDYQPPQPNDDHEWNAEVRRWVKRADVQKWETDRARALAELRARTRSVRTR